MAFALLPTYIESVEVAALDIPLLEPFGISRGSLGEAANVLVTVRLADGTLGRGEAAPFPAYNGETRSPDALAELGAAANWLAGRDAAHRWKERGRPVSRRHDVRMRRGPSCALETALLDALCRSTGTSLWKFFGGEGTELETDMTVTTGSESGARAAALAIRRRGIRIIKAKVGGRGSIRGGPRTHRRHPRGRTGLAAHPRWQRRASASLQGLRARPRAQGRGVHSPRRSSGSSGSPRTTSKECDSPAS